jgi:hypothetical protein
VQVNLDLKMRVQTMPFAISRSMTMLTQPDHMELTSAQQVMNCMQVRRKGGPSAKCNVRYQAAFNHSSAVCNVQDRSFLIQELHRAASHGQIVAPLVGAAAQRVDGPGLLRHRGAHAALLVQQRDGLWIRGSTVSRPLRHLEATLQSLCGRQRQGGRLGREGGRGQQR